MQAWDYQHEIAGRALEVLRENYIVYLAMEERTGKTLTSILIAEQTKCMNILVVTKKKAIISEDKKSGWLPTLAAYKHEKNYEVINYQSIHKIKMKNPDLVILDEPHSCLAGIPKFSATWKAVKVLTRGKPIIYLSATPKAQGNHMLFPQLALSDYSPWPERNYYEWFKKYYKPDKDGKPKQLKINSVDYVLDYTAIQQERVWEECKHLFITKTRAELGFEVEPEDRIHYVELSQHIKDIYNHILKHKVLEFEHSSTGKLYKLVCDTPIKLRWSLHMLEGGTLKIDDEYIDLGNTEKVDYILKTWGDTDDLVIMYQYKADKIKLEKYFTNATVLQATSYAEGIDLHKYKHLVIYSQDFSTAKHTQRRARQANRNREDAILVHFILVKKAVSEQVYKTVSLNKQDFVDDVFEKEPL